MLLHMHVYHKWRSYNIRFLKYKARQTENFVILDHSLYFYLGDIIILHKCTKSHDHMLHCSWDTIRDGCNSYFSFWAIFCPFTPLTIQKNQNVKKMKKRLEISSFYTCVPKIMMKWCTFLKYGARQTDGRTDKVTYRGGCPT